MRWAWAGDEPFAASAFGDPVTSTSYRLCVFLRKDGVDQVLTSVDIPAGGTWGGSRAASATGRR